MASKITRWNQVIGSKDQIKIILNAIKREVLPHFILLHGGSGIGKSTIAQLTAKSLLCEHPDKVTREPCYTCASCLSIDKGNHPGYKKINMPELYKKEDINEQIKNIFNYQKLAEKTVFVLEEIHDLKEELQRPFLEPLTNIPDDVYILSCTTKPYKLIQELLNRSFRLELTNPSEPECISYVQIVAQEMGVSLPSIEVVEKFAELCEYNPRIISDTLQVIATDNTLTEESLVAMFRVVKDSDAVDFLDAMVLGASVVDVINAVQRLEGSSLNRLLSKSIDILFNGMLFQQTGHEPSTYSEVVKSFVCGKLRTVNVNTIAQTMSVLGAMDVKDRDSFTKNLSKFIDSKLKLMRVAERSLIGITKNTIPQHQPVQPKSFTADDGKQDKDMTTSEFSNTEITSGVQLEKLMLEY